MTKIVCELICSPVGVGISVSSYVKAAIEAIDQLDIKYMTHPMGTVFEADTLDEVFSVAKVAHEAIFEQGANRVVTQLRIDDRKDIDRVMEDKTRVLKE